MGGHVSVSAVSFKSFRVPKLLRRLSTIAMHTIESAELNDLTIRTIHIRRVNAPRPTITGWNGLTEQSDTERK